MKNRMDTNQIKIVTMPATIPRGGAGGTPSLKTLSPLLIPHTGITEGEKVVIIVLIDHQDDLLEDLLMVDFGTKEARVATEGDFEFAK